MLRGLNWGHRRATGPMNAVTRIAHDEMGIALSWEQQTLAGFEHGLSATVADAFDLVVFDHPHCGDIARENLLLPLETELAGLSDRDFIGGSLDSYRYAGHLWGLPVDGATQSALYRPDLMQGHPVPGDWAAVLKLGRALRRRRKWLGLPTLAPHGILALMALCANLGHPLSHDPFATPFNPAALEQACAQLMEAAALARPDGNTMNAVHMHDAMAAGDDIAYCPIVYAYLCYAEEGSGMPLRFAPFPGPEGTMRGSVLGGAGLGITRSCRDKAAAFRLLDRIATAQTQTQLFMVNQGQPGRSEAWAGAVQDQSFAGAHAGLQAAMNAAWVRPRFPRYLTWQSSAGRLVEQVVAGTMSQRALGAALDRLWRECAPQWQLPS